MRKIFLWGGQGAFNLWVACLRISAGLSWSEDLHWAVQTVGRLVKKMLK